MVCQDYRRGFDPYRCQGYGRRYFVKRKGCGPAEVRVLCPLHKQQRRRYGQKVWSVVSVSSPRLPVAIVKKRGALACWRDVRWSCLGTLSGSIAAVGWGLLDNWYMTCAFGTLTVWHVTGLISVWRLIKGKDNA